MQKEDSNNGCNRLYSKSEYTYDTSDPAYSQVINILYENMKAENQIAKKKWKLLLNLWKQLLKIMKRTTIKEGK